MSAPRRPLALAARALALPLVGLTLSCAHGTEPDISTLASSSDQIIWDAAQKALEKRSWETARQYLKRIVDGFPQSEHGPSARIALGDSYFEEGGTANYILAIEEYRQFLTFYPSHARSDYAQFKVAESYFKQMSPPDRDQTATREALDDYVRLLEIYPKSSYAEQARQRITVCRSSLADAEFNVGYFYQRSRKAYRAAIRRFEGLLADYPDYAGMDKVLFRLAQCLAVMARTAEALPHLARLLEEYPESSFTEQARKLYHQLATSGAPSPAPPPVPTSSSPPPSGR
jgi:outer membrane protein assembly factor BamD